MLTRVSQNLSRFLFERQPEWRRYETTDLKSAVQHHHFSVLVPAINPKAESGLRVAHNVGFEIIVGFDVDHCHFWRQPTETPSEWMRRAVAYADDILNDKIVSVSWWRGSCISMTTSMKARLAKPNTKYTKHWLGWTSWRARSWSGKYDQDISNPKQA